MGPVGEHTCSRRYSDGSAVLETDFTTERGRVRLIDFMHTQRIQRIAKIRLGIDDSACHRILRRVEGLAGQVDLELVFHPFCWLRDSTLVLHALMSIGYHEAAMDFFRG